jgi:PHD/YefM family antitoxin component YafN of YafNO toxin-antitoxin module
MKEAAMTASQSAKVKKRPPEIVIRDGQPAAVILDIDDYREMLERLEELDDLEVLKRMREKPLSFRRLDEFLAEYNSSV